MVMEIDVGRSLLDNVEKAALISEYDDYKSPTLASPLVTPPPPINP